VCKALKEDIFRPLIWIQSERFKSATLVSIKNNGNTIFLYAYPVGDDKKRFEEAFYENIFSAHKDIIFMSKHYRSKIGIGKLSAIREPISLDIEPVPHCFLCSAYMHTRASFMHPDFTIRSAFYIALVSVFVGLIGLFPDKFPSLFFFVVGVFFYWFMSNLLRKF
jgi:hypothetical protein